MFDNQRSALVSVNKDGSLTLTGLVRDWETRKIKRNERLVTLRSINMMAAQATQSDAFAVVGQIIPASIAAEFGYATFSDAASYRAKFDRQKAARKRLRAFDTLFRNAKADAKKLGIDL